MHDKWQFHGGEELRQRWGEEQFVSGVGQISYCENLGTVNWVKKGQMPGIPFESKLRQICMQRVVEEN